MNTPALFYLPVWIITLTIFILIFLMNWLGSSYKRREIKRNPEAEGEGVGPVEGSMMGLMALLLAFTFNMSAHKFDVRREIIIEEATAIGTAILRCDLYPDSVRNLFRQDFAKYVEARIAYYDAGADDEKIETTFRESEEHSLKIWKLASSLAQDKENFVRSGQMVPAVNNMIDVAIKRDDSRLAKVPPLIFRMLLLLTLVSAFLSGYGQKSKRRNRVMILAFALMTTLVLYLVLELDRPRRGWITLEPAEQKIVDLRHLLDQTK